MPYILNLALGCWLYDEDNPNEPGEFMRPEKDPKEFRTLEDLVAYWNKIKSDVNYRNKWHDIHYPCIKEHFELYETLPSNWEKTNDQAKIS